LDASGDGEVAEPAALYGAAGNADKAQPAEEGERGKKIIAPGAPISGYDGQP